MRTHSTYIVVIMILFGLFLWATHRVSVLGEANKHKDSIIAEKNDSIHYYENNRGQIIAEKIAAQASLKELEEAYPEVARQLKEDFDIKFKNLKAFVQNQFAAQGEGNAEIHNHYTTPDSTDKRYPYWELKVSDGYLDFKADVIDSLHAPYKYEYNDSITMVLHTKKKGWFGKEKLYASASLGNPNAKIIRSTNFLVDSYKDRRWVVYVGLGYGVGAGKDGVVRTGFTANVGVGRALLKF